MEFSVSKEQPPQFPFCEIGLMTSNNYKVIELNPPKPKLKGSNRISKIDIQPQLQISQVVTYGRNICLIDCTVCSNVENKNLWLASYQEDYENRPENISLILERKVNEVFVGEEQIIAKCEGRDYLIYLRENLLRKLPEYVLHKMPYKTINSNYQKYTIYELQEQHGSYFLSHNEKYQKISLNMAHYKNKIKNIQTKEQFICEGDILGVHFSKYHTVCWDSKGAIYSWGLRSSWIVETNDLIMYPKKIASLDEEFIFNGVADEYYCIALNRQGQLIQWGIKNKIQIYPYQRINIKSGFERMISIKGVDKMYTSMGISGKIYFWGEGSEYFINGIPGNRQNPTICKKLTYKKISDFSVCKQFAVIVSSPVSDLIRRFKMLQINGIKSNFKKVLKNKTNQIINDGEGIMNLNLKHRFKTQVERDTLVENEVNYYQNLKQDDDDKERRDHLFKYIDSRPRIKKKQLSSSSINFSRTMQHNKMSLMCLFEKGDQLFDKISTKIDGIQKSVKSTKSEIKHLIQSNPKRLKASRYSTSREKIVERDSKDLNNLSQLKGLSELKEYKTVSGSETFRKTISYDYRLKQVTERKTEIDFMRLSTLTENTMQKRKMKKQAILRKKKQELLGMIMTVMMKDWLCRVLTKPIVGAKLMIVQQFRNSLSFEMKVKRFQATFFKKYITKKIESLSPYNKTIISNFLQRTKEKLRKKRQQKLTRNLLIHSAVWNLREKIAHMILLYTFTIKKYQKIVRWFKEVKNKKLLALRIKWNINLINANVIQFKDSNMLSEFKNQQFDELEVQDIYQNFAKQSPQLKLNNFVDSHPIFRINFNITKKINLKQITAPKSERQGLAKKHNIIIKMMKRSKISKMMLGRKTESKDNQFQKLKIYPYSQDYDQTIFSRKYNLKISQNVLKHPRWNQFQSILLQKLLQHQMIINEIHYLKQLDKYEIQMANFIEFHYENIQIKRSRYLLIPPIISTSTSNKMKRELDNMLKKAEKGYLLKEHMMEDRHIILDIALGLGNCPVKPILTDNLSKHMFKELLTVYVGKIAKAARLFNVKNIGKLEDILKFN